MLITGLGAIAVGVISVISYFQNDITGVIDYNMYYLLLSFLQYALCIVMGYALNIYMGSCHWSMVSVEDMYMIKLNDFYGSKVIFIQKNLKANKTISFNYNLNTYTMMKRVNVPLTDNVKKVLDFIKED